MGTNLFGYESYSKPLGDHFLHAAVVPCDDGFLTTIVVESEDTVVYHHEAKFASRDEARIDLHNHLAKIKKKESEEIGEFDTHEEDSIGDVQPKSHYFSRRAEAVLEHYSRMPNLTEVDPKFYGSGVSGAERKRKLNDREHWVDRTYFYDAGSEPEEQFLSSTKYVADIPDGAIIYDLHKDRDHLREKAVNPSGFLDVTLLEKLVKEAGYFGFRNSGGTMPYAVAVFYPLPVRKMQTSSIMGELLLTTVFVKRAGSTENFLQSIGAQPDVIQFVVSQPADVAKRLVNEVRKNHTLTLDQLQQIAQGLAQKQKYEPTMRELALANRYEDIPGMPQWVLLQLKKHRLKKRERTPSAEMMPNFPDHEWEYDWLKIPALWYLRPDTGAWGIVDELDMIKDWVRATQVQLASYDLLQAKAESEKWHREQSAQGAGNGYQEKIAVYAFKNGWTIQLVRSENDLKVEGNLMGHCVGSYCNYVAMGDSIIYSLRDPKNVPHATIEVKGDIDHEPDENETDPYYTPGPPLVHGPTKGKWHIVQIQGKGNREPNPEYKAMIKEWFQSLGPANVEMEGSDASLYDRLYNAEPQELADLIEAAGGHDANEYGIPRPSEEFDSGSMQHIYEFVIDKLEKRSHRDNSYWPRLMNPIAYEVADLAWNSDMQRANSDWTQWSVATAGAATPERVMEIWQKSKSAMAGIWREMDKHQEEFDKWDPDYGLSMDDYETEEKFFEAEQEARDDAYKSWLSGGFDMAVNDRWQARAQETGGKYPYHILEERLKNAAAAAA